MSYKVQIFKSSNLQHCRFIMEKCVDPSGSTPSTTSETTTSETTTLYRECPHCSVMIEKIQGCNKIHCLNCKTNWCFYCGLSYPKSRNRKKKIDLDKFCKGIMEHKHLPIL